MDKRLQIHIENHKKLKDASGNEYSLLFDFSYPHGIDAATIYVALCEIVAEVKEMHTQKPQTEIKTEASEAIVE